MARILIVRQSHVPLDPRVARELRALQDDGHDVDVLCTRRPGEPIIERRERLRFFRVPLYHRRGGAIGYLGEYVLFFVVAFIAATALHMRRHYDIVQVHTLPDALVFSSLVPRLTGARVLLDLHECMPEFFATKFGVSPSSPVARVLSAIEQASIRFADAVITCTDQMRDAFVSRGADPDKIDIVLNSSDEAVFDPRRFPRAHDSDGDFVLVCHGAIEERYGLDTIVRAVALLACDLPRLRLEVYGEGSQLPVVRQLASELGVRDRVRFSDGYVPIDELVAAVATADAGVVAMKRDPFRDLTQCNKMYDFVAMRRPAIVSRTASALAYFDEGCFAWFESENVKDLARAIREVHDDGELRRRLVTNATLQAAPYRWSRQRERYLAVVRSLIVG
jgi:glycosyltransferase involved in cell wall biosynthesis